MTFGSAPDFDPFNGAPRPEATGPAFLPLRVEPSIGWILPGLADRIINDARAGFSLTQICARQRVDAEVVIAGVERGRGNGLISCNEALRILGARE